MYDNYYKKKRELTTDGKKLKYFGTKSALLRGRVLCRTRTKKTDGTNENNTSVKTIINKTGDNSKKYLERTYPTLDKSNYLNLISAPHECVKP